MFKWRSDKNKITAVFKLQFHATQVSEHGLVISVVPAANGKPTARLEKPTVKNNGCYWETPVYETVKFLQDPKTGKIQDRIYCFLISTGSTNGDLMGEFSVNITDYISTTKPCSVSFPLKNSISDSYLNVTIQRVQENSSLSRVQRDLEESEGLRIIQDDKSLKRHFSNGDAEEGTQLNSVEDQSLRKTASHPVGFNGTRRGSNGSDITMSSSDSSSGLNTPREPGGRSNNTNTDQTMNRQDQEKIQWDLAIVPVNDSSTENSMNSPRDFFPNLRSPIGLDDSIDKLRAELVSVSRRAEVSELELQTLRKQIVKESKKGQDLSREICSLKEERDALKDECEKLKAFRKRSAELNFKSKFQFEGDPWSLIEVIREELNYEKEMNTNLRIQLQKTQDSNEELIFAVQDLEEMLEKNCKEASHLPDRSNSGESAVEIEESILKSQSDDDEAQKALEDLVRQHSDAQENYVLEQKIMDLCSEIEMYRRDKDELEMQMEQLALDYEILKQENHEFSAKLEQNHLQEQLKMQCDGSSSYYAAMKEHESQRIKLENELKEKDEELSCCLAKIKDLEDHNKVLEKELQKQAERYEESHTIINDLETRIVKLKNESKKHLEELSNSLTAITELEAHNNNLEEELEKHTQRYEALAHEKKEQEERASKAEEAVSISSATINELEGRIKELENELKKHSEELKAHIQTLEEDLEKQAEEFEADLEALTRAKVEQEQRAIRAEEALKLVKWKNANTAARIQDEFKRLSSQMQSSFEANEKLASKALTEASGLRTHNRHLQDLLQKAQEDLQSTKDEYEVKLQALYDQINTKSVSDKQNDQILEIERLTLEKESLAEQMKVLTKERDLLAERENMMHDKSVKEMEGKFSEELNLLRNLKNEKEQEVTKWKSEVEELTAQCDNFKNSLYEDELEKERLRKQVFQLKADMKKKDEAISSIEKKFKEKSGKIIVQEKPKSKSERSLKEIGSKEVSTLKERVKFLEGQIKSKEAALDTSTNAFLAKEKDLNRKIEQLEIQLRDFCQNQSDVGHVEVKLEKVSVGTQVVFLEEIISAGDMPAKAIITDENSNMESNSHTETDSKPKPSDVDSEHQQKIDVLLKEMVLLKEKNNFMETELHEMQERYSEISLKFAEVEGERQQLIMKVRNLKNARKS